jgi:septum formation protein
MLILASASPRRQEILEALGIEFEQVTPEVEELREGAPPEELVVENARRKARAGLAEAGEGAVSLGVDTEVVLDGVVLGKAETAERARDYLGELSGRTHEVLSGLVLLSSLPSHATSGDARPDEVHRDVSERSGVARSSVTFRELDQRTLTLYLDSGEWRDRAGAYAIQGLGSILIERLEGDFSNVVGLPVGLLLELAPGLVRGTGEP